MQLQQEKPNGSLTLDPQIVCKLVSCCRASSGADLCLAYTSSVCFIRHKQLTQSLNGDKVQNWTITPVGTLPRVRLFCLVIRPRAPLNL